MADIATEKKRLKRLKKKFDEAKECVVHFLQGTR